MIDMLKCQESSFVLYKFQYSNEANVLFCLVITSQNITIHIHSVVLGAGQDPLGKVDEPMQLCTEQRVRAQDILPPKHKSTRFVLLLCAAVQAGTK